MVTLLKKWIWLSSQDAIDAINSGKVELSTGYTVNYEPAPEGSGCIYPAQYPESITLLYWWIEREQVRKRDYLINKPQPRKDDEKPFLDSVARAELKMALYDPLIQDSFDRLTQTDSAKELETVSYFDAQAEKITKSEADRKRLTDRMHRPFRQLKLCSGSHPVRSHPIAGKELFASDSVDAMKTKRAALSLAQVTPIDWTKKSDEEVYRLHLDLRWCRNGTKQDEDEEEDRKSTSTHGDRQLSARCSTPTGKNGRSPLRRKFIDAEPPQSNNQDDWPWNNLNAQAGQNRPNPRVQTSLFCRSRREIRRTSSEPDWFQYRAITALVLGDSISVVL